MSNGYEFDKMANGHGLAMLDCVNPGQLRADAEQAFTDIGDVSAPWPGKSELNARDLHATATVIDLIYRLKNCEPGAAYMRLSIYELNQLVDGLTQIVFNRAMSKPFVVDDPWDVTYRLGLFLQELVRAGDSLIEREIWREVVYALKSVQSRSWRAGIPGDVFDNRLLDSRPRI